MKFEEGTLIKELGFEFKERPDGMYGDVYYKGEKVSNQSHSEDTFNKMEVHTGRNGKQYATSNKKNHFVLPASAEEPTQATEEVTGKYVKVGMMEDGSTPIYRAPDGSLVEGNFRDVEFRVQMNAKHTKKTTQFLEVAETIAEEQGLTNINEAFNEHGKHLLDVIFMHFDMELKQD